MISSGENQLTSLEKVEVILLGKTFTCNALENIELGSKKEKWSIVIGGRSLNNSGQNNERYL